MNPKILFVDDDPNILAAYDRQLRKHFEMVFALGGEQGLEILRGGKHFAVVVTDMSMPHMNGIDFLGHVRDITPDIVRIMLTGYADVNTAIKAVNEENIFRFLTKPCAAENLAQALNAGIRQYQLINSERELLEKTLSGSLRVMTEILNLVNPNAFSRAERIWRYSRHITTKMQITDQWQFDLAAMLSQIGCITLPPEILDRIYAHRSIAPEDLNTFRGHPSAACKLLINIPRLEPIARMIENQQKPYHEFSDDKTLPYKEKMIALGAQILKASHDYDQLIIRGESPNKVLMSLKSQRLDYNPEVLVALESYRPKIVNSVSRTLKLADLQTGMIADEDLRTKNGMLLVQRGQEITFTVLTRIRNFAREMELVEPFMVKVEK
jgi:response regulator RpfG family c-di-GMP phosphodiesterase